MSISSEKLELITLINNICDYISGMAIAAKTDQAALLRQQIGDMRANGLVYLNDQTFGTELLNIFATIRTLGVTTQMVAAVRQQIMAENPVGLISILVVETAIIDCLTTECILITQIAFKSQNDVEIMMQVMKTAFDAARDQAATNMDSATYQTLTYLAGSIISHLNQTALVLPRVVLFDYQASLPSLYLANLIYQDTTRSDELIVGNQVVNPVFMPRSIMGYSA
jgi:prophage DNA circulation protein